MLTFARSVTATANNTCVAPRDLITYPTAALGTSAATATTVADAASQSGSGAATVQLGLALPVPAGQQLTGGSDTFNSTLTITIASGP